MIEAIKTTRQVDAFSYFNLVCGVSLDALSYARRRDVPQEASNINLLTMSILPYLYRSASGVERTAFTNSGVFRAYSYCYAFISRCDDMIDTQSNENSLSKNELLSDPINKTLLLEIERVISESPSPEDANQRFIKSFYKFLDVEYDLHTQFKNTGNLNDLISVRTHKEITCGLSAQLLARMFSLFNPETSQSVAKDAEKFLISSLLYCQVYDDVGDYVIDRKANTPNYFSAALAANPDERENLMDSIGKGITKIKELRQIVPYSFLTIDLIAQEYLASIPIRLCKLKNQVALARNTLGGKITKG